MMASIKSLPALSLLAVAASCLSPAAATAQTATASLVCESCWISGISADGKHATGQYMDNYETFSWKQGGKAKRLGRSTLDVLGVSGGWPSISADGKTIASSILSNDGTLMTSGIWTKGTWTQITPPLPEDAGAGDSQDSSVWAISGDGKVVSGLYWRYGHSGGSAHPFYWTAGTNMVGLSTEGGSGRINGSSKDGKVLAGWQESPWGGWVASVWVDGVGSMIGNPDGFGQAQAVSPNGKFIVGQDANADWVNEAAIWGWNGSSWGRTGLGVFKGTTDGEASATGVSANGKVVVGWGKKQWGPGGNIGFVWTQKLGKLKPAKDFFAKYGYNDADYDIGWVMSVSPDGKSFAVVEQMNKSPWTMRSQVITLTAAVD
jgi:uncharacterized membrane protein